MGLVGRIRRHPYALFFGALIAVAFAYTFYRACTLRIDYCDSFMYRQSAMRLWGYELEYFDLRPPLLAMLLAPVIELARSLGSSMAGLFRATALEAAVMSALSALAVVWALKRPVGWTAALFGGVLFVANRFFVRYGAHVMTDVITAGTISAAIAAYLAGRDRRHLGWFALCGFFLGMTALLRYNVVTVFAGFFVGELYVSVRRWRVHDRAWTGLLLACFVALVMFVQAHRWVFEHVYGDPSLERFFRIYEDLKTGSAVDRGGESPWDYWSMGMLALGPIPFALAGTGLVLAVLWPKDGDGIFLGVFLSIGGALFITPHTEARYALPLLPSIVYFGARTVEAIGSTVGPWLRARHWTLRAVGAVVVTATCAQAAAPGVAQAVLDDDPIFRTTAFQRVAQAMARVPSGRAWWNGMTTTLCPRELDTFPEDDFFNVFHSCVEGLAFYTGRAPLVAREPGVLLEGVFAQRGRDGDLLIQLSDLRWPDTRELLRARPPMRYTLSYVVRTELALTGERYEHVEGERRITMSSRTDDVWTFTSTGPRGRFSVFARTTATGYPLKLGSIDLEPGRPVSLSGRAGTSPERIVLVGARDREVVQAP